MKYTHVFNWLDLRDHPELESIRPGDPVLVTSRSWDGGESYYLHPQKKYIENGYPGNLDRSVCRFHGWRGTTDGISRYAYGVYHVKSVEHTQATVEIYGEKCKDDVLKIVLRRTDLAKDYD